MKYLTFCLVVLFLFPVDGFPQTRKTAVGTLVSNEGGNRQGIACLKIKGKTSCFEWGSTSTTKFFGLPKR